MKNPLHVAMYAFLLISCCLSALAKTTGCQTSGKATVVFDVTDGLGERVGDSDIKVESFLDTTTRQESRQKFKYAKGMWSAKKIPYGRYTLRVHGNKFAAIERPVDVCDPFVDVEVPTRSGIIRIAAIALHPIGSEAKIAEPEGLVQVVSFQNEDGTDFSKKFEKGEASNIPYGFYELKAIGPIGGVIRREVDVFQPEVWVLGGFNGSLGDVDFAQPNETLRGVVTHIPDSEKPVFVRLVGIDCEGGADGKVDEHSGAFSMAISIGDCPFLLLTMGKSGILDARDIDLPMHAEIDIDLDHAHPLFKQ